MSPRRRVPTPLDDDGEEWGDDDVGASWADDEGGDEGVDDEWGDDEAGAEWTAGGPGAAGTEPGGDRPEPDEDELAAIRTIRLVAVALVLAVVGLAAVALARAVDDDDDARAEDNPTLSEAPVVVGPPAGAALVEYVAAQRAALASVEGRRVAVVSFVSYRADAGVDELLAGVGDVDVVARLIALPGGEPVAVDQPIGEWLEAQRTPLQAERDAIAELLPSIENPEDPFIPAYTEELARLDAQLAALDPAAELVSGVIVRASGDALRRLAEQGEVRVVAVGPSDDVGDLATYRGLRPEELEVAGTPPTRPTPVPA